MKRIPASQAIVGQSYINNRGTTITVLEANPDSVTIKSEYGDVSMIPPSSALEPVVPVLKPEISLFDDQKIVIVEQGPVETEVIDLIQETPEPTEPEEPIKPGHLEGLPPEPDLEEVSAVDRILGEGNLYVTGRLTALRAISDTLRLNELLKSEPSESLQATVIQDVARQLNALKNVELAADYALETGDQRDLLRLRNRDDYQGRPGVIEAIDEGIEVLREVTLTVEGAPRHLKTRVEWLLAAGMSPTLKSAGMLYDLTLARRSEKAIGVCKNTDLLKLAVRFSTRNHVPRDGSIQEIEARIKELNPDDPPADDGLTVEDERALLSEEESVHLVSSTIVDSHGIKMPLEALGQMAEQFNAGEPELPTWDISGLSIPEQITKSSTARALELVQKLKTVEESQGTSNLERHGLNRSDVLGALTKRALLLNEQLFAVSPAGPNCRCTLEPAASPEAPGIDAPHLVSPEAQAMKKLADLTAVLPDLLKLGIKVEISISAAN